MYVGVETRNPINVQNELKLSPSSYKTDNSNGKMTKREETRLRESSMFVIYSNSTEKVDQQGLGKVPNSLPMIPARPYRMHVPSTLGRTQLGRDEQLYG